MYGSDRKVRNGASAATRSRTLRRISRRLSAVDVIAERELREVPAVDRDEEAAQEAAEDDAAVALVGRQAIRLALRVVEFLLPRLHVHVGVGELAEINLRACYHDARHVL